MPRDTARTRAREIVARLRNADGALDPYLEFESLDALPPDIVREELEPWLGVPPSLDDLDDDVRKRHRLAPRALVLEATAVVEDADVLDLGSVAEKQLRIAGKTWDGADLEPEERLDGELEGNFAGTLRHIVLADARTKKPMFDVVRFHEDQAVVFRAGTIDVVAFVADGIVEMRDRNVAAALTEVLAPAPAPAPAPAKAQPEPEAEPEPEAPKAKPKRTATAKKKTASGTATTATTAKPKPKKKTAATTKTTKKKTSKLPE